MGTVPSGDCPHSSILRTAHAAEMVCRSGRGRSKGRERWERECRRFPVQARGLAGQRRPARWHRFPLWAGGRYLRRASTEACGDALARLRSFRGSLRRGLSGVRSGSVRTSMSSSRVRAEPERAPGTDPSCSACVPSAQPRAAAQSPRLRPGWQPPAPQSWCPAAACRRSSCARPCESPRPAVAAGPDPSAAARRWRSK